MKTYADDISITPLAIPMLCGPGAIANAIMLMDDASTFTLKGTLIGIIALVYFITFFGLIQEKDNYSTRSGMTTAATIYNNNPVPVVHNAAVRIRTKVGSTSKYSANPPHTPNKKRSFLFTRVIFH